MSVINGTLNTLEPVPGASFYRWQYTINTPTNGGVETFVLEGATPDESGNPNFASNVLHQEVRRFALRLALSTATPYYANAASLAPFLAAFTLAPVAMTPAAVAVSPPEAGTVTSTLPLPGTPSPNTTRVLVLAMHREGLVRVTVPAAVVRDVFGNFNEANFTEFVYDVTPPVATITTTMPYFVRAATLGRVTVVFSEPMQPQRIVPSCFVSTQGTASALTVLSTDAATGGVTGFSALFSPGVEGLINVTLNAGVAVDLAANPTANSSLLFVYDVTPAVIALTTDTPYYARAATLGPFTATANEPYMFFNATSVSVTNGAVAPGAALLPVPGGPPATSTGTFRVVPAADGPVTVTMVSVDRAGNVNAPATHTFLYDGSPPEVAVSSGTPGISSAAALAPFTATCSETMVGFLGSDIAVQNGVAVNVTAVPGSGNRVFTFAVVPSVANGTVVVSFPPGRVFDLAFNGNLASRGNRTSAGEATPIGTPFSFLYDDDPPRSVITSGRIAFGGSVTRSPTIPALLITFHEPVCCMDRRSVSASGATVTGVTPVDGSNTSFVIRLRPSAVKTTVRLAVVVGSVADPAGNGNLDSRVLSLTGPTAAFEFLFDNTPFPVVAVTLTLAIVLAVSLAAAFLYRKKQLARMGALAAEHARRAMINVNRITDVEEDYVKSGHHARARQVDIDKGVSYYATGGWLKYSNGDNLA